MRILTVVLSLILAFGAPSAMAQDAGMPDVIPAKTVTDNADVGATHPAVRLTPDKSEIINLDGEAFTIIVGNPVHLSVLADSSRRLVLVPQAPGSTHFTVLDQNGDVLMQRHVIVASPKKNYVRVRRACNADSEGCANTSVYYCPDMCHEIALPVEATEAEGTAAGGEGGAEDIDPNATEELTGGTAPLDE